MPTAKEILSWANVVANDWRWLAILWHLGLAAAMVWLAVARPSPALRRLTSVDTVRMLVVGGDGGSARG